MSELLTKCSECGSSINIVTRYVTCVSRSFRHKLYKEISGGVRMGIAPEWFTDNMEIWPVTLCSMCTFGAYKNYLTNSLNRAKLINKVSLIFIVSVLFLCFFNPIFIIFVLFGLFYMSKGLMDYTSNSRKLKAAEKDRCVPEQFSDKSFIGEAQRLHTKISKMTVNNNSSDSDIDNLLH